MADLGQSVAVDQEKQVADFILDHVVLFLPLKVLMSVKGTLNIYRKITADL